MIVYAVDDEDYIREIFAINFKQYNEINLTVFEHAEDLFEKVKICKPDVIVSDIIMPGMTGLELCSKIKSTPEFEDIYFILLTAKISVEDKITGLETGADDYITKPFKFKELAARIKVGYKLVESIRKNKHLINELKIKNQKLTEAYDKLKVASEKLLNTEKLGAIGKITSIISHELKNPLFAVTGSLYLMKNNFSQISASEIDKIEEKINYCIEIIDNINQFAKTGELVKEKVSVSELIFNSMLNFKIPENIQVSTDVEDADITVDKIQFKIVILNIIKNAVEKFSGNPGKIQIKSFFKKNGNSDELNIVISDNGAPLTEDIDVFAPFYTTKIHGSGLGLSFSKLIIENHNGKISAFNGGGWVNFEIKLYL
ncbi:response regulator [Candidatus Dependentiae bacterium]|nr:response regulator [Candidatus Dependentiae bacterium]